VALGVVGVVALSFVLPGVLGSKPSSSSPAALAGVAQGAGLPAGAVVPAFSGTDLLTGKLISSTSIYDHKTLLFFSEGVSCQACLEQIQGLQRVGSTMAKRAIELVSITPDPPGVLRQAIAAYGITTPVISDVDLSMSQAFNTLGQGMHADTPGHAFALIYHGKVLWYHDYWISNNTMYVQPATLLTAFPKT
jgi:peroxiredoxin